MNGVQNDPQRWLAKKLCEDYKRLADSPLTVEDTLVLCLAYHLPDGVRTVDNYRLTMPNSTFIRRLTSLTSSGWLYVSAMESSRRVYKCTERAITFLCNNTLRQ